MSRNDLGWLARWRVNRIAKRYARVLPRRLKRYYGRRRHYTKDQIDAAIRRSGVDPNYSAMAYLLLLPYDAFEELPAAVRHGLPSERVQAIFAKHFRNRGHLRPGGLAGNGAYLAIVAAAGSDRSFWSGGDGGGIGDGGGDGGGAF